MTEPLKIPVPQRNGQNIHGLKVAGTAAVYEGEPIAFPAGCMQLLLQPRMGGDFYAEIKMSNGAVAAAGATVPAAIGAALARLGVAA